MRDARTLLLIGGVVALVAAGTLGATLAGGGGADTANGSVPVHELGELAGGWFATPAGTTPAAVQGSVRLELSGDRVVAETGCNALRGTASVEDGRLVTGPLMATRMACEPALMEQERWVTAMLAGRPRLELSGPYLALHWGEGERWWLALEREGPTVPAS